MHRIADLIAENAEELVVLGTRDNGTEIRMSYGSEPGTASATFRHSAECVDKLYGEIAPTGPDVLGMIQRVPVGVVGVIVPWNAPLMIAAWKVSAALAVGNSVVYGLAACVWTADAGRAHRMIAGINAGVVQVNSIGRIDNVAPLGGVKQSGNGVDKSLHAFDKYLDYKTAWLHI